ncbi:hypothetical protein V5P93_005515 [Actinokineospora auranticolor]|uniref:Sugar lactone lactonase YvrE n=1 Tax=Actinokineospora auranticolor TaxID=155976 RepID=A0A2S6GQE9_9PSEU|nr:hypothetical protein [Actinokineospora auranticolor]PPK67454.1 hypothetical protein CLV40_107118 [Actinokineospora auranticolor]
METFPLTPLDHDPDTEVVMAQPTLQGTLLTVTREGDRLVLRDDDRRVELTGRLATARECDRIGDSYLLLVDEERGRNACVVDANGAVESEFSLGSHCGALAVDADRRVWGGYLGWAIPWEHPAGADATGRTGVEYWHPGVVRWDEHGEFHWVAAVDSGVPVGACYALDTGPHGVIAVTDADEPVLLLDARGRRCGFGSGLVGPSAVAYDGRTATCVGRYKPVPRGEKRRGHDVVTRLDMVTGDLVEVGALVMPDGGPVPELRRDYGRGTTVTVVLGRPRRA